MCALALPIGAARPAGAHGPQRPAGGDAVLAPAKAAWLGERWAQIYALPVPINPLVDDGDPCLTLARGVVEVIGAGPCRVRRGTAVMLSFGTAWSSVEPPFPSTAAGQRAAAQAADRRSFRVISVTVDTGRPILIRRPRFELLSPQRSVRLPADNLLSVPGGRAVTLSAHAWGAVVRNLAPGLHVIVGDALFADEERVAVASLVAVAGPRSSPPTLP